MNDSSLLTSVVPVTKKSPAFSRDELQVGFPDGVVVQGGLQVTPMDLEVVDIIEHLRFLILARDGVRHFD